MHQLFEAQVERTPHAVAVEFENERWTYQELNALANRLARRLRAKNVGRGSIVGVHLERSAHLVTAVLGVLKAGAAYLPLDPFYPSARLRFMLQDSAATTVITEPVLAEGLSGYDGQFVSPSEVDDEDDHNLDTAGAGDDLAYLIYTSGSTGKPKGVDIEHHSVVNFLGSMRREPGLAAGDVLAAVTSLSFDIHVLELYLPLIVGARLVVVPREVSVDGIQLRNLLARVGATVMQATPATWRLLLSAGWPAEQRLRRALCGGEAMPRKLAEQLLERCDELWNMYGPTETTVWSTVHRVEPGSGSVPIGRPIDNTTVYVLDDTRQPVAAGEAGELYIGGDGLARGYWGRSELTAERFLPNPFTGGDAKMYRTGDLVRRLPSGVLDCLGRIDHQVKIRGYRIELEEIEAVLAQHPAVRAAVVHARDHENGEKQLIAYLVPSEHPGPAPRELIRLLQAKLPSYMVPAGFVTLDEFPLTPNGKVDRNALPAPQHRPELRAAPTEPASETERRLRMIWEDVLGVRPIGVEDEFVEIGGDSMSAMQVLLRVEGDFQRSFFASLLAPETTIRRLAAMLDGTANAQRTSSLVLVRQGSAPPLYFLPGLGGLPDDVDELAPQFPAEQTVYALRAPGLDGELEHENHIERLAARHLADIAAHQPRGPYYLAGWSFGALVAFEMACQLQGAGEQVAYLGLVDEVAPHAYSGLPPLGESLVMLRRAVAQLVRRWLPGRGEGAREEAMARPSAWVRIRRLLGYPVPNVIDQDTLFNHLPMAVRHVIAAHIDADATYAPGRLRGRVFVYRTSESWVGLRPDKIDRGWKQYVVGDVSVRHMPGTHFTLHRNPHAPALAQAMAADIEAARAATAPRPG
ncbi:MAG TPA: amino acid adenylation domain-containing protein [Pirellulales bacterium]|nr:amino acid adenylation domain-containing protein [Pirellulales bacterium]